MFKNWLQIIRETGIVNLLRRIIRRTPRYIFERKNHIWLSKNLNEEEMKIEPKIPVSINLLRSEFIETLDWIKASNFLWGHYEKELKVATDEGHYWVNAKSDGKIVGCMKIGFGKVFVSDYEKILQFPRDVFSLYEMRVVPECQGKKIASYLLNESSKFCKERGYTKGLGYVNEWNVASCKSLCNAGFKEIKTIYYYKILGMRFLTANPADL